MAYQIRRRDFRGRFLKKPLGKIVLPVPNTVKRRWKGFDFSFLVGEGEDVVYTNLFGGAAKVRIGR